MSFISWLFGTTEAKDAGKKTSRGNNQGPESTKSLIERIIDFADDSPAEESNGDTQRFIRSQLDAAKEADSKRVENKKETDEKVEEHRKRADTVMRKVAEKTLGMSDILVRKNGEWVKDEPLTEEEQEAFEELGFELQLAFEADSKEAATKTFIDWCNDQTDQPNKVVRCDLVGALTKKLQTSALEE